MGGGSDGVGDTLAGASARWPDILKAREGVRCRPAWTPHTRAISSARTRDPSLRETSCPPGRERDMEGERVLRRGQAKNRGVCWGSDCVPVPFLC